MIPESRQRILHDSPDYQGQFVLYYMSYSRRVRSNFALERAIEWSQRLGQPLVVLDVLFLDYPAASERHHRFQIDGMADLARCFHRVNIEYYPFIETVSGEGESLIRALMANASITITDDYPLRSARRMQQQLTLFSDRCIEAVDSIGLLPMASAPQVFPSAYAFRRFLQKSLNSCLREFPTADPLKDIHLPSADPPLADIRKRWPKARFGGRKIINNLVSELPISHAAKLVDRKGGPFEAERLLKRFLTEKINRYSAERNEPESDVTSGLSPYLHYGFISPFEIVHEIFEQEDWSYDRLGMETGGHKSGWWGVSEDAEAFLDQLVTWRELGFNFCQCRDDYDRFESLPVWAKSTLKSHANDLRPYAYSREDLETCATHDPLWNAAQGQLLREGRIHNYLRMLWGKKILEWTPSPQDAAEIMTELNDQYALDGSDPNSYSGIFWILGRYDRPWGPERPIFGTVRYMSSANTARKVRVKNYITKYAPEGHS